MIQRSSVTFVGFGEAAMAFADGLSASAYDRKTESAATEAAKLADYACFGIRAASSNADACKEAQTILALVTADQALAAAQATAAVISPRALYLDMNSVAPDTKRAAARAIVAAGGRYADVAIMAPAQPARRGVPLLVSGADAEDAVATLQALGFHNASVVGAHIGDASTIKMIRSVMVKGVEALSAECALAAHRAGVGERVIASLDASAAETGWRARFDYNLDRMLVHGTRRAAEMAEVVKTLDALGTGSDMARATAVWQDRIGALQLAAVPGLAAKLDRLSAALDAPQEQAA